RLRVVEKAELDAVKKRSPAVVRRVGDEQRMFLIQLCEPVRTGAGWLMIERRAGPLLGRDVAQQMRGQNRKGCTAKKWREGRVERTAHVALANLFNPHAAPERAGRWVAGEIPILYRAQCEQHVVGR